MIMSDEDHYYRACNLDRNQIKVLDKCNIKLFIIFEHRNHEYYHICNVYSTLKHEIEA